MQRGGQHPVGTRLAPEGLTHYHEAVAHDHHLEDLQDLLGEEVGHLQVHLLTVLLDGHQQVSVVRLGQRHPREQVRGDTLHKIQNPSQKEGDREQG